ncbi:MAG: L-2-amino-thiazoline-4-carboxylic acid hydrolase [Gemmatimonadota bacterium]
MKNGHYTARSQALLRDFDETVRLARARLAPSYGHEFAVTVAREVRHEYERLIPEIPFIRGVRARLFNAFLRIAAQELAVYRVMKRRGRTADEAWEICHEALVARMDMYPAWKAWLLRKIMFSRAMKRRVRRRATNGDQLQCGDFEVRYLIGDGEIFDWGVDYVACGNCEFMKEQGAEEFAPYVCLSDMALGEALGWGLTRTETLADGCDRCDFRFKKGGGMHISSPTPEVQKTIKRIQGKEWLTWLTQRGHTWPR